MIAKALDIAVSGVPGPVFIEIPVDLLYSEEIIRGTSATGDTFSVIAVDVGLGAYSRCIGPASG